jgi:hypothetical protein
MQNGEDGPGAKATVIVQLAPAASEFPHVVDSGKSDGVCPRYVATNCTPSCIETVPLFCSVTVCGALLAPSAISAKLNVVADAVIEGATPGAHFCMKAGI